MQPVDVLVQRLDPAATLPRRQHAGDAGMDLATIQAATIAPGERALLPTGIAVALPAGYVGFVVPRSGLAVKHGVSLVNAPGTIDPDYRGEVCVILGNIGRKPFTVRRGMRIAQMVVCRVARAEVEEAGRLDPTQRGEGGFGPTGG